MAQYTINAAHCSVFGMDAHARSVTVCGPGRRSGEMKKRRFAGTSPAPDIAAWARKHFEGPYYAAYESGCCGFHLARALRAEGIDCDVVAVTSIARSADDRQRKTDKRDAKRLLSELLSPMPAYTAVWIPDEQTEAARDLARARADAADALKRAKQQLSALLLRHGHAWDERTRSGRLKKTWGREHWAWVKALRLEGPLAREALGHCIMAVEECAQRLEGTARLIERHAQDEAFKPYAGAPTCLKGLNTQTAFLAAAQFGRFSRFKNGRSVSKWLGVVPRESSSGERQAHGRITKAGDGHLRSALVEGCGTLSRRGPGQKKPRKGQEVSEEVASICRSANKRLKSRYTHLTEDSRLHADKARMAVVSELVRWIWVVGRRAEQEIARTAGPGPARRHGA